MGSLNKTILIGKVLDTPDMRFSVNGAGIIKFNLEVKRPPRVSGEESPPDKIPIVAFSKQAEMLAEKVKQDDIVMIEGRVQVRTYNKQDGQTQWSTEVVALSSIVLNEDNIKNFNVMSNLPLGTDNIQEDQAKKEENYDDIPF
ncbi:Single-strand DNA-binding [Candidatus Magnetomorum sp. HK-1]|nr:Single-strand DNA-binding [Candidatus Magnetomorum sp. HK-1]